MIARHEYDPFVRGQFPVGVRTISAVEAARDRVFPCEVWYPAGVKYAGRDVAPISQDVFASGEPRRSQMAVRDAAAQAGTYPLMLFSHSSGGDRRQSTFLCTHMSSRTMPLTGELARIQEEMLPFKDLCSADQSHLFVRGLTLCHMDAMLKELEGARRFWGGDIEAELEKRGVSAIVHRHLYAKTRKGAKQ